MFVNRTGSRVTPRKGTPGLTARADRTGPINIQRRRVLNQLLELTSISTDPRRVELARILASGVIRVLTAKLTEPPEEEETSEEELEDCLASS